MDRNAPVLRLKADLLGDRDFPVARVTIPETLLDPTWDETLKRLKKTNPEATNETLLRALVVYGLRAVNQMLDRKAEFKADGTVLAVRETVRGKAAAAALAGTR